MRRMWARQQSDQRPAAKGGSRGRGRRRVGAVEAAEESSDRRGVRRSRSTDASRASRPLSPLKSRRSGADRCVKTRTEDKGFSLNCAGHPTGPQHRSPHEFSPSRATASPAWLRRRRRRRPGAALDGTLKKIKDTGKITLGVRESSSPFSFLDDNQKVVGYSIDLCMKIVDAVKADLKMPNLRSRRCRSRRPRASR